ncbi:hypothetical protein JAAARDRAFT_37148 [Jaapia argillacea MUCL 33604]|uniref:Uncharacterized protein n=1 Tax=Jaapia argillacea MUCL 33604 TaxID=933084 RepID=A0A067PPI9_9AGAM|nr:hypothetical protein JAAARDRAFT_37148 [Jaapia argillacea MUCL 33604]
MFILPEVPSFQPLSASLLQVLSVLSLHFLSGSQRPDISAELSRYGLSYGVCGTTPHFGHYHSSPAPPTNMLIPPPFREDKQSSYFLLIWKIVAP